MSDDELPFQIVRTNGSAEVIVGGADLLVGRDAGSAEVIACAADLLVGQAAFDSAARLYPKDLIELRNGALVIGRRAPYDKT